MLKWLAAIGVDELTLVGGEPPLHHNIEKAIDTAKKIGIEINVFTNGCHDLKTFRKILRKGTKSIIFHYDPGYLKAMKENKTKFYKNLEETHKTGKKILLRFNTSNPKFDYSELVDLAEKYNANIGYSFTVPGPRVEEAIPIRKLKEVVAQLLKFFDECDKRKIKYVMGRPLTYCMFSNERDIDRVLKYEEVDKFVCPDLGDMIINPDLSLQVCSATPYTRTEPIKNQKDLAEKLKQLTQIQHKLLKIPSIEDCKSCKYFLGEKCQGGCFGYKEAYQIENSFISN